MVTKHEYVMYDLVNNAVWVSYGPKKYSKTYRFKTQREAYAKARQLALKLGYPIYDKYYGKMVSPKKAATKKRKKASTSYFGFFRSGI